MYSSDDTYQRASRVAHHEAGHAVVGAVFQFPVRVVHIENAWSGWTDIEDPRAADWRAQALIALAGGIAEAVAVGDETGFLLSAKYERDRATRRIRAAISTGHAAPGWTAAVVATGLAGSLRSWLADDAWVLVDEVAHELQPARTLEGLAISELLASAATLRPIRHDAFTRPPAT